MTPATLDAYLNSYIAEIHDPVRAQVAETVRAFATAAMAVRKSINEGALGAAFAATRGAAHADGDVQKELDVHADDLFLEAARKAGVAWYASEELASAVAIDEKSGVAVAIDPLDGSSNIDTNVSIGTIFGILPNLGDEAATFRQPGHKQLGAGFFIYGPQLALAVTLGAGTKIFVYSSRMGAFVEAYKTVNITAETKEFAINASNYRNWDETTRCYVDDCLQGADGPRDKDFNMRWIASLVAEAYRILIRGGVFLYPRDQRKGYAKGRLRLVYEANPIAFVMEQAGGAATEGASRILDIEPTDIHQRTPLVFGSAKEVGKFGRYHTEPSAIGSRHPLFGNRGLFRT